MVVCHAALPTPQQRDGTGQSMLRNASFGLPCRLFFLPWRSVFLTGRRNEGHVSYAGLATDPSVLVAKEEIFNSAIPGQSFAPMRAKAVRLNLERLIARSG